LVVPYKIIEEGSNYQVRLFNEYDPKDLYWHRDNENRYIELIDGECKLQIDNRLPISLKRFNKYYIGKGEYHRVIAKNKFTLKIFLLGDV
jgi:hypothetical protein